ncbi:MAG: capsular biosynthesis protein [Gammaproteobacteria bacterium]|nr:capsular biosynthesis protein [Gammaproteobacteria bacterium]MBU1624008.1 capsular biosynthesis protein [Gammaproteobacteria bacterium]MBU1981736.1 capsular biosynthesis protein [Gammaproteobacteria bacterium]
MIKSGLSAFKDKRILLLQGPVGPFFRRLSRDLTQAGAQVFKVNFNGGDWLFYNDSAFNYRGHPQDWPAYFEKLLDQLHVDMVMLFGDCRRIHRVAHGIAHRRGVEIGVFEEGYIRPHYITLERFGVNDNSPLPRLPLFYLNNTPPQVEEPLQLGKTFWYATLWAMLYYFAAGLLKPFFRHYEHHRPLNWLECLPWLRSAWRKWYYAVKEYGTTKMLTQRHAGRYFLVPLQVHNDAQIKRHSGYASIQSFIDDVMMSFAHHAPRGKVLVIKHHPMDRGYRDYAAFIEQRANALGLQGRCFYIHDQHLPSLLDHASGVVVVNSTVGLSAILHGAPVKVCGNALYDMKGLTFHRPLNKFWREAQHAKPDPKLLKNFHDFLVVHSQVNGSFYKRLPIVASASGLRWTWLNEQVAEEIAAPGKKAASGG